MNKMESVQKNNLSATSRREYQRTRRYQLGKTSFGFLNICNILNGEFNHTQQQANTLDCMVVNSSTWGYCVHLIVEKGLTVPINEFIALKESHSHSTAKNVINLHTPWIVGQVRWARYSQESILLGIQRIPALAQVVEFNTTPNAVESASWMRALYLPQSHPLQSEQQLITTFPALCVGDEVQLRDPDTISHVRLTDMEFIADKYYVYSYTTLKASQRDLDVELAMVAGDNYQEPWHYVSADIIR